MKNNYLKTLNLLYILLIVLLYPFVIFIRSETYSSLPIGGPTWREPFSMHICIYPILRGFFGLFFPFFPLVYICILINQRNEFLIMRLGYLRIRLTLTLYKIQYNLSTVYLYIRNGITLIQSFTYFYQIFKA